MAIIILVVILCDYTHPKERGFTMNTHTVPAVSVTMDQSDGRSDSPQFFSNPESSVSSSRSTSPELVSPAPQAIGGLKSICCVGAGYVG